MTFLQPTTYNLQPTGARAGQSLMELIIAIAIGAIMIVGAITLISPSLKSNSDTGKRQTAASLGKELLESVRVVSEANWHNIDGLATSSANVYYLITSSSPFSVATGTQTLTVGSTTYRRSFYLDMAIRDIASGNGNILSSGSSCDGITTFCDPSTLKITVNFGWTGGPTSTLVDYLTRTQDSVLIQGQWTGGPVASGSIVTNATNTFATSSNLDYTSSSQSIEVTLP